MKLNKKQQLKTIKANVHICFNAFREDQIKRRASVVFSNSHKINFYTFVKDYIDEIDYFEDEKVYPVLLLSGTNILADLYNQFQQMENPSINSDDMYDFILEATKHMEGGEYAG